MKSYTEELHQKQFVHHINHNLNSKNLFVTFWVKDRNYAAAIQITDKDNLILDLDSAEHGRVVVIAADWDD